MDYEQLMERSIINARKVIKESKKIGRIDVNEIPKHLAHIKTFFEEELNSQWLSNLSQDDFNKTVDKAISLSRLEIKETPPVGIVSPFGKSTVFLRSFMKHFKNLLKEKSLELLGERIDSEKTASLRKPYLKKESGRPIGETYAVFLSHADGDRRLAILIKNLLSDLKISSFVAHEDLEKGKVWEPTLIRTLKDSKILIILATKEVENSAWVNFEIGLAYENMVPLFIHDLSDKVSYIKNKQGIKIKKENLDSKLVELIVTIHHKLGLELKVDKEEIVKLPSFIALKELLINKF